MSKFYIIYVTYKNITKIFLICDLHEIKKCEKMRKNAKKCEKMRKKCEIDDFTC